MPADPDPAAIPPEALAARLLHRDGLMLILDKPAGLPVHRGPKGGPSLDQLLDQLRFGLPRRPELAHRLDKDTSGCLVLGRHRQALQRLGRLFARGLVLKTYWAVVLGAPPADQGRIDLPLARRSDDPRSWWMQVDPGGQPAVTDYRVRGRFLPTAGTSCRPGGGVEGIADPPLTWLELRPETGRTHQLRVHLAALGCPILGDRIYGRRDDPAPPPLHLHARAITVPLYPNRAPISACAPVPSHMQDALRACGFTPPG
jgi:tRNA pseudouridine32 synthase / 23S rRNA pseudouridine746 synthase